jgi:hypothetical protein
MPPFVRIAICHIQPCACHRKLPWSLSWMPCAAHSAPCVACISAGALMSDAVCRVWGCVVCPAVQCMFSGDPFPFPRCTQQLDSCACFHVVRGYVTIGGSGTFAACCPVAFFRPASRHRSLHGPASATLPSLCTGTACAQNFGSRP